MTAISWTELEAHLRTRLAAVDRLLRRASGEQAAELRGKAQCYEELLNLPETLSMLRNPVASSVPHTGKP